MSIRILCILQNQWFKDPEGVKRIFQRWPEKRNYLISTYLFMGCLTGRRLRSAFGEELCDEIVWEEASPEIGGVSSAKFPADPKHIADAIMKHEPAIVIALGFIAASGVMAAMSRIDRDERFEFEFITGPHPAARQDPIPRLREIARAVKIPRVQNREMIGK